MPRHRLGIVHTAFERADGERVAKIVDPRPSRSWSASQADRSHDLQEYRYYCRIGERRSLMSYEKRIALTCRLQSSREVSVQGASGRRVERQHSALLELGLGNDQAVVGHVGQSNGDCLRNTHAGRCNQPEHRGVGERSDCIVGAKSMSGVDQPSDLPGTIDVRCAAPATGAAEKISGGNFMPRIFGMQCEREAAHPNRRLRRCSGEGACSAHSCTVAVVMTCSPRCSAKATKLRRRIPGVRNLNPSARCSAA